MKKNEIKPIIKDFLLKMCDEWFDDLPIYRSLSKSLIEANQNKYDAYLDVFSDENGNIDENGIFSNLVKEMNEPFKIDFPLLPRTLLIQKTDIERLMKEFDHYK